ncbi:MAG: GNAT family N-acyltransferase [Albidovulum sp.]
MIRAQRLRALAFRGLHMLGDGDSGDADVFDARCRHVLVEEQESGHLVATFRLMSMTSGAQIGQSYGAQFYDLSALSAYQGRLAELGRFCHHPDWHDPDILRIAWAALTRMVDSEGVAMLFGCSSFAGTDGDAYGDAFGYLAERHIGPDIWRPGEKAAQVIRFGTAPELPIRDIARALKTLPPLLRTYLAMGGWVSDHAVIDPDMGTMHVFTGLEISAIPAARVQALRQIAGW